MKIKYFNDASTQLPCVFWKTGKQVFGRLASIKLANWDISGIG